MTASRTGDPAAPTASIVIAARDAAEHLPALRRLVDAQVFGDFEVVCVDDASTDGTAAALQTWAADSRATRLPVTVVTHERQRGAAAARRSGLLAARGRFVWFVDADDRFPPTALDRLVTLALEHGADVVTARATPETEAGEPSPLRLYARADTRAGARSVDGRRAAAALFSGEVMGYLWDKLFSRQVLLAAYDETIDLRTHEDLLLVLRVLAAGPSVVITSEPLYRYVVRPSSLSRRRVPSYPDLLRCAVASDELVRQIGPVAHHAAFLTRYIGLAGIEDAARKGGRTDVRRAVAACREPLRRAPLRQVLQDHGPVLTLRVLAARLAPSTYAGSYRLLRRLAAALREVRR